MYQRRLLLINKNCDLQKMYRTSPKWTRSSVKIPPCLPRKVFQPFKLLILCGEQATPGSWLSPGLVCSCAFFPSPGTNQRLLRGAASTNISWQLWHTRSRVRGDKLSSFAFNYFYCTWLTPGMKYLQCSCSFLSFIPSCLHKSYADAATNPRATISAVITLTFTPATCFNFLIRSLYVSSSASTDPLFLSHKGQ